MESETKAAPRPRSKAMRYILIILAALFFWTSRYALWFDQERVVRYNKWTGAVSVVPVQTPLSK